MQEKRKKLLEVVHTKGCSLQALRHITNKLAGADEQKIGKDMLSNIAQARLKAVQRNIALPLTGGKEHSWPVADLNLLVASTVRSSGDLQDIFANALLQHTCSPSSPWRLLVTWDEFTPGSLLRPQNQRKAMVVNMTFQELGTALQHDTCWWTVAIAKSTCLAQVVGGWSRMLRDLLKLTLCSPTGIQTVGLPLELRGALVTIYAKVGCLLSDADGLRMALQWMGAGSLHPCFRHWNVLKKGCGRAEHDTTGTYVEIQCHDTSKFKCWRNSELAKTIDLCASSQQEHAAGRMYRTHLEDFQRRLGFKATEEGLLADPELRRHIDWMGTLRYDWPHTFLSDGIVGAEMWALVAARERHHIFSQDAIYAFLKEDWQFPGQTKRKQKDLCRLFNEQARKTNEDALTIKASMSDLLGLYCLLRHFVEVRLPEDRRMAAEVYNFQLVCKAVDLLLAAKKRRVPVRAAGRQLHALLEQHLQRHVQTHGAIRARPKPMSRSTLPNACNKMTCWWMPSRLSGCTCGPRELLSTAKTLTTTKSLWWEEF